MLVGNSSDAKPETSENWSTGFRYKPAWIDGLELSTTFYNIAYSGKLSGPNTGLFLSSAANRAAYAPFIHAVHNPGTCSNSDRSTWDPVLKAWFSKPAVYTVNLGNPCDVNVVFDGRTANLSAVHQRGIDFNINYYLDAASYGTFSLGVGGSTILDYKQQAAPGQEYQQQLNGTYQAVRWRGHGSINWMLGTVSANLIANYVGGGKNTAPLNTTVNTNIKPFVSFDAGVNYRFDDTAWVGLRGIRLSLNAQNVFDQNPPITLMSGSAVDMSRYYMASMGRILTLQLTKDF
jgi:iron complex outermembrane receptor protein